MVEGQGGWNALIVTSIQTRPGEVTLVSGINPLSSNNLTQLQGTVVHDSGWIGFTYSAAPPPYSVGDEILFGLTVQSDKLLISDQTNPSGSASLVLCGPEAPQQSRPPTSHAEVKSCAGL